MKKLPFLFALLAVSITAFVLKVASIFLQPENQPLRTAANVLMIASYVGFAADLIWTAAEYVQKKRASQNEE